MSFYFWIVNTRNYYRAVAQAQMGSANPRKDSGYDGAASSTLLHETMERNSSPNPRVISAASSSTSSSPPPSGCRGAPSISCQITTKKNGNGPGKQELKRLKSATALLPLQLARSPSVLTVTGSCKNKDKKNATAGSRFTIYKANKASKKKREKSSAKKERKATKTLAIVLGKSSSYFFTNFPIYFHSQLFASFHLFGRSFFPR